MSLILQKNNRCLFESRKQRFGKLFNINKMQCSDYQIIGDDKFEEEFELDFIAKGQLSFFYCNTNLNSSLFTFNYSLFKWIFSLSSEYV